MVEETVQDYLERRERVLTRIHPYWATDSNVYDRSSPLQNRLICIPPNWDLIKTYTGTIPDEQEVSADFNQAAYKRVVVTGERGEADFLRRMQDSVLTIGGLLVGNVNSHHIMYDSGLDAMTKATKGHVMPKSLSDCLHRVMRDLNGSLSASEFEIDFVLIHPRIGFYQVEVKSTINPDNVNRMLEHGADQIVRGSLQKLFGAFCEAYGQLEWLEQWERYNAGGAVYFAGLDADNVNAVQLQLQHQMKQSKRNEVNIISQNLAGHFEQLVQVEPHCRWVTPDETLADYFDRMTTADKNYNGFFEEQLFRQFAVFLSTFRPNFYISSVLCVLQVYRNLSAQCLQAVNYYRKSAAGQRQNLSKSAVEYLQELRQNGQILHSDIKFPGRNSDIYFTEEQLSAVAVFSENHCRDCSTYHLTNTKQLIMGPPGSGKSLIVMMKLFILAQIRPSIPLVCVTWKAHSAILRNYIEINGIRLRSRFEREVHLEDDLTDFDGIFFDCVLDEQYPKRQLYHQFRNDRSVDVGCISVAVVTGGLHLINDEDERLWNLVQPMVLRTAFRSTNAIQRHLRQTMQLPIPMVSGHSFEGIPPEIYNCNSKEAALSALEELVRKLSFDLRDSMQESVALLTTKKRKTFSDKLLDSVTTYNPNIVPSLEFPIVIVFGDRNMDHQILMLAASRAICHLITFTY